MRRAALAGGLLVLAVGVVAFVYPFLTRERNLLTSTPQPPAATALSLVELRGGQRACLDKAVIEEHSELAIITVGTYGRPPTPLQLSITGPGLRDVSQIPPTYVDNIPFTVPVVPPAEALVTTICVRNKGRRKIALYGGADRTSRSTTLVDGEPIAANFAISFAEREQHTLLERLPLAVDRMQAFRPDVPWLAWLVGFLFLFGMPLGAVWAFATGAHDDEEATCEPASQYPDVAVETPGEQPPTAVAASPRSSTS